MRQEVMIRSPQGLHARPASTIAQKLNATESEVTFIYGERSANGRSVMEMLMLAARGKEIITIDVEGPDAGPVMAWLIGAFESGFEDGQDRKQ